MKDVSTLTFDLDGTISNPSSGIFRCINYALRSYGYSAALEEQVVAEIGPPLDETFSKFCPEASPEKIRSLIAKYRERYADVGYSENSVYTGVQEALTVLTSRGIRMGVCTSKRADFAEKILSMFGLIDHFSFIDGGDVGIKKQDQLAGLLASGQIDVSSVMIGDRNIDITSAKANGLRSVGVLWGFGGVSELSEAGANVIIKCPSELEGLVL